MSNATQWLFDLGNSRLKYAQRLDDGGIGPVHAIAHDGVCMAEGWQLALPARIDAAHVASVAAPELRVALLDVLSARCGRIGLASTQRRWDDVEIAYPQPSQLGVDRFLALLAARNRSPASTLIVGVGTALTIDWLDGDGRHRGGRIAPSPRLMRNALHGRAAQLPESGGDYLEFADNTLDALASGCVGAALALIDHSLQAAQRQSPSRPQLLLHGGGSEALRAQLPDALHAPQLVLEGLAQWSRDQ